MAEEGEMKHAKLKKLLAQAKITKPVSNIDDLVSNIPIALLWKREAILVALVNEAFDDADETVTGKCLRCGATSEWLAGGAG